MMGFYGQAIRETGLGRLMRLVVAFLLLLTLVQPGSACHRFSRWHYPWPQPCNVNGILPSAAMRKLPQPAMPLPDLTPIVAGEDADEATRVHLLLRAALEKGKN
jgi:hypothetical protein